MNGQELNEQMVEKYLNQVLINKFFKILPMREDNVETLDTYMCSLLLELKGNRSLITKLDHDPNYLTLLSTLQYFITYPDEDVKVYKREVFKCINLIKKIYENTFVK